jgi:hypothetical protein
MIGYEDDDDAVHRQRHHYGLSGHLRDTDRARASPGGSAAATFT